MATQVRLSPDGAIKAQGCSRYYFIRQAYYTKVNAFQAIGTPHPCCVAVYYSGIEILAVGAGNQALRRKRDPDISGKRAEIRERQRQTSSTEIKK